MPIESLLLSVGLRFLIFSHPPAQWILNPFDLIFGFNPIARNWWEELKGCPFCNGFWVFLLIDLSLYPIKSIKGYCLMVGWGILASLLSLFIYLIFSILCDHPANKLKETKLKETN